MSRPGAPVREFAALTTRGLRRPANEDALAVAGALMIGEVVDPVVGTLAPGRAAAFIVSDGVGGRAHGARASQEVAAGFLDEAPNLLDEQSCLEAVLRANLRLNEIMLDEPQTVGMAATIAGVAMRDDLVCWFNIGDSRVYRHGPAGLVQLSIDDTQPGTGSRSRVLLRSLGGQRSIAPVWPHVGRTFGSPDDSYLVCSDGLWSLLSDAAIADILNQQRSARSTVRMLLEASLLAGGSDNVSIIVVRPTAGAAINSF